MIARLTPRPLRGEIAALPSKSQAHRALICAALAKGKTRIVCGQTGQDVEALTLFLTVSVGLPPASTSALKTLARVFSMKRTP